MTQQSSPVPARWGLEGIVSKRVDMPYRSGRGEHWLKSKSVLRQEFIIIGYTLGGPKEVADTFEQWFSAPACDGFVVGAACVPGSYEDFIAFVVPELQRRGLFQKDYKGETLRENLGLPRPFVSRTR